MTCKLSHRGQVEANHVCLGAEWSRQSEQQSAAAPTATSSVYLRARKEVGAVGDKRAYQGVVGRKGKREAWPFT